MEVHKNPRRRFKLILFFASILLALAISFFMRIFLTPYELTLIDQSNSFEYVIYHDFDKDGISERVTAHNDQFANGYRLHVRTLSGDYIDQCNYSEPTYFNSYMPRLVFGDYNGDGLDEVFAFTQKEDSLFLYMHDLRRKQVVIKRQFLVKAQASPGSPRGLIVVRPGGLIELNQNGDKGLVFTAIRGARQSRGVYIYDVQKQMIINRLENSVFWWDLFFYDLTGNGRKEIILTGHATGNVKQPEKYSDDKCWLFVLDHSLKPIFEPIPFGEYSSALQAQPFEADNKRYLLLAYHYQSNKDVPDFICLVSPEGKLLPELRGNKHLDTPLISKSGHEPNIFFVNGGDELLKMNKNFKITARKPAFPKKLWKTELVDIDRDGREELLCWFYDQLRVHDQELRVYDQELKPLAKIPMPAQLTGATYFTFRETGPNNPIDLGINFGKNFYLYAYQKNGLYSLLPFISIGFGPFIFLILLGGHKFSWLVFTYIHYTRSALQNAQNGVALLDGHGMIYFFNDRLGQVLRLKTEKGKRKHYADLLQERPPALRAVQAAMETGKPAHQQFVIRDEEHQSECEIFITPFVSPLKLIRSYLVEIKESADFASNARLQSWSNSVRKIAHEIKTPLASIALNLKAFEMRLDELLNDKISAAEQEQLDDDIKTMRLEIKRIEQLTKSFINFTNLEKPNLQIVNVRQMLEHAIGGFNAFTNARQQIQANLDPQYNEIWADPQQIGKVLQILIENAVQALNGMGVIEISTAMAQYLDKPFVSFLEFEVADTGPGIASTDHEKIFEPFYTTKKEEGTGMGLPIAKKIVEEHGGKIGLHSRPGFGAVIRFSVPLYEEKA